MRNFGQRQRADRGEAGLPRRPASTMSRLRCVFRRVRFDSSFATAFHRGRALLLLERPHFAPQDLHLSPYRDALAHQVVADRAGGNPVYKHPHQVLSEFETEYRPLKITICIKGSGAERGQNCLDVVQRRTSRACGSLRAEPD